MSIITDNSSINALAALSKCTRLRYLDLSLVSEAFTRHELSHTLQRLQSLRTLHFPRAGIQPSDILYSCLPIGLRECIVSGGLKSYNIDEGPKLKRLPFNLTHLTIGNCDQLQPYDIVRIVGRLYMPKLEYLKLEKPMALAMGMQIGCKLLATSNIRHLCAPIEFLSPDFWTGLSLGKFNASCSLDTLELDFSLDRFYENFVNFDGIFDAVSDGYLGNLRRLNLHRKLAPTLGNVFESDFLNDYLKALAREDEDGAKYSEDQAGIWLFGE